MPFAFSAKTNSLTILFVLALAGCAAAEKKTETAVQSSPQVATLPLDRADFASWLSEMKREAVTKGIRPDVVEAAFAGVEPIPRIIELDRKQPEFTLSFSQYMDRVVPPSRVEKGRAKVADNRALIEEVGKKYGVQPRFIAALWGVETDFGRTLGGFNVVHALTTLAYDGRRSAYFRQELMNALTILNEGHVTSEKMVGSWAGAMGQSQFMPSSFLKFAQDYDGDGHKDIWNSQADVFASAANYLAKSGWDSSTTWGREVHLPPGFELSLVGLEASKSLSDWQGLGVRCLDGSDLPNRDLKASLVQPKGEIGRTFLVYDNFRTIMKWNKSTYFALAVGRLADGIGGN
ncbi:MAG: lytic transglycosylase [Alphaproteobacteria bacterium RIFOXYD12_FULL_60_8]|nr:MAG: lytic transglycosylase [Alphaproteobacteria bacterium RIFOXYD12_FULL_60_8]